MGGTPALLAPYMSHECMYNHTETSVNQAEQAGGAMKYECRWRMNILASLKKSP